MKRTPQTLHATNPAHRRPPVCSTGVRNTAARSTGVRNTAARSTAARGVTRTGVIVRVNAKRAKVEFGDVEWSVP